MMTVSKRTRGYFLGIFAAAAYGSIPLFTIPLYREGMHADSVLFWRYILAIPIMALLMLSRKESFRIRTVRELELYAGAGILVGLSSVTLFLSYNYMDVGIASTLLFLYPVMVALIMSFLFHERLGLYSWMCLLGAIVGIGLLSRSGSGALISLTGAALVFISSLTYAIYIVTVNRTKLRDISSIKVIFYVLVFGMTVFVLPIAVKGMLEVPVGVSGWGNVLGLAIFPTALSFWLTTLAIQYIGATNTAILGAFEPVTGVLVSVLAFNGVISGREFAGIIMILVSVTMITAGPVIKARHKKRHDQ